MEKIPNCHKITKHFHLSTSKVPTKTIIAIFGMKNIPFCNHAYAHVLFIVECVSGQGSKEPSFSVDNSNVK
jgi:hypothetical protein